MIPKNYVLTILLATGLLLGGSSCKRTVERMLVKGTYEVVDFKMNGGTVNLMEIALKNYVSNSACCRYEITFDDNGTCTASYFINDTLDYSRGGTWELLKRDVIDIKLDLYVDGIYEIEKHDKRNFTLFSSFNKVDPAFFGGMQGPAEVKIIRTDI